MIKTTNANQSHAGAGGLEQFNEDLRSLLAEAQARASNNAVEIEVQAALMQSVETCISLIKQSNMNVARVLLEALQHSSSVKDQRDTRARAERAVDGILQGLRHDA